MLRSFVLTVLVLLGAVACKNHEFICKSDTDCVGQQGDFGSCLHSHCAFYDPACVSMLRFEDSAGSEAQECVPVAVLPDGGVGRDGGFINHSTGR